MTAQAAWSERVPLTERVRRSKRPGGKHMMTTMSKALVALVIVLTMIPTGECTLHSEICSALTNLIESMCRGVDNAWAQNSDFSSGNVNHIQGSATLITGLVTQLQVAMADHGNGMTDGEKTSIALVVAYASTVKNFIQRVASYLREPYGGDSTSAMQDTYTAIKQQTDEFWVTALGWCEEECFGACMCR